MGTYIFLHISSRYAKIFGETNFRTREIPRSGSKAEDGGEERERERLNNGENNGQATHGARKHAWRTQAAWANKRRQILPRRVQLCQLCGSAASILQFTVTPPLRSSPSQLLCPHSQKMCWPTY